MSAVWNTCSYMGGTHAVVWVEHMQLCGWNTCSCVVEHMQLCGWNTCSCVDGTHAVVCVEHMQLWVEHMQLCGWNTCSCAGETHTVVCVEHMQLSGSKTCSCVGGKLKRRKHVFWTTVVWKTSRCVDIENHKVKVFMKVILFEKLRRMCVCLDECDRYMVCLWR